MDEVETASERRRARRTSVMLMANIDCAGISTPVRLTNVSSDGAAFVSSHAPAKGAYVELWRNEVMMSARLVWATPSQGGISFGRSLDPRAVMRSVPAARLRHQTAFRRPALKPEPLSRAERDSIERCSRLLGIAAAL